MKIHLFVFFLLITLCGFSQDTVVDPYTWNVQHFRAEEDKEFRDSARSPLKKDEIKKFTGKKYYAVDSSYRVIAKVKLLKGKKKVIMKTSSPKEKEFIEYAQVSFELNGKKFKLYLYQNASLVKKEEHKNNLFLPFTDNTNGSETYGGGRYIDLEIPDGKTMIIDFNYCYNPYCAFTTGYSCPVPPEENYLDTEVKAGEKKYRE